MPKNYSALVDAITAILPDATVDFDHDGQILVYTNLTCGADGTLVEVVA